MEILKYCNSWRLYTRCADQWQRGCFG